MRYCVRSFHAANIVCICKNIICVFFSLIVIQNTNNTFAYTYDIFCIYINNICYTKTCVKYIYQTWERKQCTYIQKSSFVLLKKEKIINISQQFNEIKRGRIQRKREKILKRENNVLYLLKSNVVVLNIEKIMTKIQRKRRGFFFIRSRSLFVSCVMDKIVIFNF